MSRNWRNAFEAIGFFLGFWLQVGLLAGTITVLAALFNLLQMG